MFFKPYLLQPLQSKSGSAEGKKPEEMTFKETKVL